jgi:pimeloyl-ACP methyl ester carboxylesterase
MPYLQKDNLNLHYTDHGHGEPIITVHGLSESGLYWTLPGITDGLASAGYRVINMDMRGHGRTQVAGSDKGYKVEIIADDISALADHLNLKKFHLLTHASGGMAGFRYAIKQSDRLLSMMVTNSGSATLPSDEISELSDPNVKFSKVNISKTDLGKAMIASFRGLNWEIFMANARKHARQHIYLNSVHRAVNPESAFAMFEAAASNSTPDDIADFISEFYDDPDPQISGLRQIDCPVLMLEGEYDIQFLKPAELIAREVPNCRHVVLSKMGHMLALEDPMRLLDELIDFLEETFSR